MEGITLKTWLLPEFASTVPEGLNEPQVRADMLNLHGIEIGAGLGDLAGKIFRIGLMGNSSTPANVKACLAALESVLATQNRKVEAGKAVAAAESVWASA